MIINIENSPTTFGLWVASFLGLIMTRLLVENWLTHFQNRSGIFLFYEFTHTLLFFLLSYILILVFLSQLLKINYQKISNILLWGFLIILTPPIVDNLLSRGRGLWSFYDFGSLNDLRHYFFSFFDKTPDMGITYGVRLEVALAIIFLFIYAYLKSKDIAKSLAVGVGSYVIFFILGTFPSWITIIVKSFSKNIFQINDIDTAQMFLSPAKIFSREFFDIASSLNVKMSLVYSIILTGVILIGLFLNYRNKFMAFLKNVRLPQIIYHAGLLLAGVGLGAFFNNRHWELNFFNVSSLLVLLISISSAWLTSVIINDIQDKKIDQISNASRPLITEIFSLETYRILGWILFSVSILFSAMISLKIAMFLMAYQALAWTYSAWPLRLKRFAFLSTFISALASLMIFFAGYILISPEQNIDHLPFNIILLLIISLALSLPIKDLKDIKGDKKDSVYTIPVIFGEEWGKIIVASGLFISYILSVILLNEFRLFWWALLGGGASFWVAVSMKNPASRKSWVNYRNIFWWIMGVVVIYGVVLVKMVFL